MKPIVLFSIAAIYFTIVNKRCWQKRKKKLNRKVDDETKRKKKTICFEQQRKKKVNGFRYCKINSSLLKKLIDI